MSNKLTIRDILADEVLVSALTKDDFWQVLEQASEDADKTDMFDQYVEIINDNDERELHRELLALHALPAVNAYMLSRRVGVPIGSFELRQRTAYVQFGPHYPLELVYLPSQWGEEYTKLTETVPILPDGTAKANNEIIRPLEELLFDDGVRSIVESAGIAVYREMLPRIRHLRGRHE